MNDPKSVPAAVEFDAYDRSYAEAVNDSLAFTGLKVDFFTRVKADYLIDLIGETLGDPSRLALIDIGCGIGNYHKLLADKVGSIAGVDVSTKCLAVARERNPSVDYQHYDGAALPFANARFDVAFAVCVYHHVPANEQPKLTADVKRVLKPGGLFVIFEHNPLNPLTMRVVNSCVFDKDAVLLRPRATKSLLTTAGFDDVWSRHILSIPAVGRALRSVDRTLGLAPFGAQYFATGRA